MNRRILSVSITVFFFAAATFGQTYIIDMQRESARSDKVSGGISKAAFVPGDGNIKVTINVPSFQMTLWQNGKEIRTYPVGVGMLEYPLAISLRQGTSIEWNPVWIPPSSDWIDASSTVRPGEIILPTDPRNPLGKVKIPLGYGYLLHQAKGPGDMGSLVSHGCVRVMQSDLYDLADKIVAARGLDVTPAQIAAAKRTKKTLVAKIEPGLPVEITYDTMVIEGGTLHIYPDVYENKKNTVANLRAELRSSGVDDSYVKDSELRAMIAAAKGRNQFAVRVSEIEAGNAFRGGRVMPVIGTAAKPVNKAVPPKRTKKV
jgi:hypothetical protein